MEDVSELRAVDADYVPVVARSQLRAEPPGNERFWGVRAQGEGLAFGFKVRLCTFLVCVSGQRNPGRLYFHSLAAVAEVLRLSGGRARGASCIGVA